MILTIDIGNTTTSFGIYRGERLSSRFSIATQPTRTPDEVTVQLTAIASSQKVRLEQAELVILCSVVPRMSALLVQALRSLGAEPIRIVGQDCLVPLVNKYTYPAEVGQDRLVGAFAAWKRYRKDCVVADFGTAITIDLVTKKGEYWGGVIAPGIDISLEALAARTALLPRVELREPPELLGRDTANSIRSGLIYGCAALCDGIVTDMRRKYAPKATVVATGGASRLIAKYARTLDKIEPNLVLDGLFLLSKTLHKPTTKVKIKK